MKKRQCKLAFVVVFMVLLFSTVAFSFVPVKLADALESSNVTIHNNGNGTVTVGQDTIISSETDKTIVATVSEDGTLEVSAEGTTVDSDGDAKRYIFQYWSTDSAGNNVVSVKATDTFSYEECKTFTDLYANFVEGLPDEKREENKIKVSYEERLGGVYFFMGKENPTQEEIVKHGILIENEVPTELPFKYTVRKLSTRVIETINASKVTLAAIPKNDITSTLDSSRKTTAQFIEWSAEFGGGTSASGATYYNQALPPYMNNSSVGTQDNHDGTYEISATATPVGAMWYSYTFDGGSIYSISSKQKSNDSNNNWYWNRFDKKLKYGTNLYVKPQSISVEFKEVAPVPKMTLTPTVGEVTQDPQTTTDLRTTISIPYGEQNSLRVLLEKLPSAEKQSYDISVKRTRDLATGEYKSDDTTKYEESDGGYLFGVDNIDVNTKIVITPDYGEAYWINPIVIDVMLTEEIEKIVAEDSAQIETMIEGESEQSGWYLDPQFNSNSGALSFTSKNSYPETVTDKGQEFVSNLHFKVKGSGVFTFEFYLDGVQSFGGSVALYRLGTPVTLNDFTYQGVEYRSEAKQLAIGKCFLFADLTYIEPEINTENGVERLNGSTGWCVATIQIKADADQTTDIYVAHGTSDNGAAPGRSTGDAHMAHAVMSVRNVGFYQGQSNVSWSIYGEDQSYGEITAQVNGEDIETGSEQGSGTRITFTVNKNENHFYGWSDGEKLLSTEETFTYTVHGGNGEGTSATNIYAVVAPENTYYFQNGGKFYKATELQKALDGAKSNPRVYILQDVEVKDEINVPSGVQLILPYDADGNYIGNGRDYHDNASAVPSWKAGKAWSKPYLTFTLSGNMTVKGTFYIGAVNNYEAQEYSGLTSGAYSQLVNNGTITVFDGGFVDVYGLVTGSGKIDVQKGAKIAQPFLILDYSGGSNTLALYQAYQTPFNRYAMINVQCPITVNYGGELLGHASLYALGGIFLASAPVISYATKEDDANARGLIMLTEGGKAEIVYNENDGIDNISNSTKWIGKTKLTLTGGAIAKFMALNVGFTISTEDVVAFSVPYNFDIELNGGEYTINGNFKLMPGSSLTVNSGATLNINSNFFVYDGLVQSKMSGKYYPTADELSTAGYSTNANFIVNGTLNINSNATFLGVVQTTNTTGAARINVAIGATISGTITDGGIGAYDCNYMEYESSLRLYDKVHKSLTSIPAGEDGKVQKAMTFISTWTEGDNDESKWSLPATSLKYDSANYGSSSNHPDHNINSNYVSGSTKLVSDMVGSWKFVHDETHHVLDWTKQSGDPTPSSAQKAVQITRQCSELGCDHSETKKVLYILNYENGEYLGELTYKGTKFDEQDIKALFDSMFGAGIDATFNIKTDIINVGAAYEITITLTNDYWYGAEAYTQKATVRVKVVPANLTAENAKELTEQTYKGSKIQPEPEITFNDKKLDKGTDYSLTYGDNTNVGNGTVTVNGNGNFTGEFTLTFNIKAKDLSDGSLTLGGLTDNSTEYTGKEITPAVTFNLDGYSLNADNDYDIIYAGNTNAGQATVTVRGKGNFTGEKSVQFTITPKSITSANVEVNGEFIYNRKAHNPTKQQLTVTIGELKLGENDYEVTYGANTNAGDGTVIIKAVENSNYTGTVTKTFTIKKATIDKVTVTSTHTYNKQKQNPVLEVKSGELTLNSNEYSVTYSDEALINAGEITVTVTGSGANFEGEMQTTFIIAKATIQSATVTGDYTYNGKDQTPTIVVTSDATSGSLILTGSDYDVTYKSTSGAENVLKNAGTVTVTVTAKDEGNFTGSVTATFEIKKAKVNVKANDVERPQGEAKSVLTYTLIGEFFEPEKTEIEEKITLTVDDQVLTAEAGKSFDIVVSLDGKENYTNYDITLTNGKYTIIDAIFKDVVISEDNVDYDGQNHNLNVSGYPDGAEVTFKIGEQDFNGAKDAGTYNITVKITYQDYKAYEQVKTLTINKKAVSVQIRPQTFTYNGESQSAKSEASYYDIPEGAIIDDDDIVITLTGSGKDVGSYEIEGSVSGQSIGNYDITFTGGDNALTIEAARFTSISVDEEERVYNRQAFTPEVTVIWNNEKLEAKDNYEVSYSSNTNAGEATVTVTGKGNFEGCVLTTNFTITAATITEANITSAHEYNGKEQTPTLNVSAGEISLNVEEYKLSYEGNRINAGEVTVTVTPASDNFTGSTMVKFNITKKQVNVTLNPQEVTYNGAAQNPMSQKDKDYTAEGVIDEDDLQLTISVAQDGECKNAGSYALTATCGNDNYAISIVNSANFVIKAEKITIQIKDQSSTYSGTEPTVNQTEYEVTDGEIYYGDDLDIKLSKDSGVDAKTYSITATWNHTINYDVTFNDNAKFTINKATITVTIGDLNSVYGDDLADLKPAVSVSGIVKNDEGSVDIWEHIQVTSDANKSAASENYKITVTKIGDDLDNYDIVVSNEGKYTVSRRQVTVTILDQQDVYGYDKTYTVDQDAWKVTLGDVLEGDDLEITLSKNEGNDAADYDITGTSNNANYEVTFVNGTFTVNKLDVSDDATFTLSVGGKTEAGNVIHVKYEGSALTLLGVAFFFEGENPKQFEVVVTIDGEAADSIDKMGDYTVVVTINDTNYSGSASYTVKVSDQKGYTQKLYEVLTALETLKGDLAPDELSASDFDALKAILAEIDKLDEVEKEAGAEELKPYNDLIDAWNELAQLDESVIQTARNVADFPLGALFEAIAAANALLALAYIAIKGVKLI